MNKQKLEHQILDDGFTSPARMYGLKTYKNQEMQALVSRSNNVPLVKERTTCLDGWTEFQGSCYKTMFNPLTWYQAYQSCKSQGSHLVTIEGPSENSRVSSLMRGKAFWTGGYKDTAGRWKWAGTENLIIGYSNWARGQPDNYRGIQNRLVGNFAKHVYGSGYWDDDTG